MGLDHIKELLSGRRSSRLVLVVSDLEVLVVSAVRQVLTFALDEWFFLLALLPIDPVHLSFALARWSFVACRSRLEPFPDVFLG